MKSKKIFVVSDVHGYFTLLKEALDKAGYEKENEKHLLVCCGDFFDRGEESMEVLDFFCNLKQKIMIRGNHEDDLLKMLLHRKMFPHNFINGTEKTLDSVFGNYCIDKENGDVDFFGNNEKIEKLKNFISQTINCFQTKNYLFVHGWFPKTENGLNIDKASEEEWIKARKTKWINEYTGAPPVENKTVVCGHFPSFYAENVDKTRKPKSPEPFYGNGLIVADGGTNETGKVNVIILEDELI